MNGNRKTIASSPGPRPEIIAAATINPVTYIMEAARSLILDGFDAAVLARGFLVIAAATVVMSAERAKELGLAPLARLVTYAVAGVPPEIMGIGPVPAVKSLLEKMSLTLNDIDVFEVNEAFAAQALAVTRELKLPEDRTNPNGSGISLGHPIGATGCILVVKALYELKRVGGQLALVTMCIGGGQGIAALFARD